MVYRWTGYCNDHDPAGQNSAVTSTSTNFDARHGIATFSQAAVGREKLHPLVWAYLLTVILPVGFNIGSVAMTDLRVLLMLTVLPTTVKLFAGKYGKVYPVDYLFYLHILWASVALLKNNPGLALQNVGAFSVEFLGGYALARAYIRTPAAFVALIRAVVLLIFIALPFAFYEAKTGSSLILTWLSKLPGFWTVAEVNIEKRMGLNRVQVYFAHPIHFGLFCSSVLSLTFVAMRGILSDGARYLASMAVCVCVFLSLSSGALLAALLQMELVLWAYLMRRNEARWKILLAIFAVIYVVIDLGSNRTPLKVFMTYATFSTHNAYYRSIIFEWGMINVWANPIFGLGLRNWIRPHYMRSGSMDNFWLVMAVRYGIPGFLTIALGYADAIYRVGRRKLTPGTHVSNMRIAWMFTFIGLCFTLMTVHIWTSVYSYVFFLLGAGMWMASTSDDSAPETTPEAVGARPRSRFTRQAGAGPVHARGEGFLRARQHEDAPTEPEGPVVAETPKRSGTAFTRFGEHTSSTGKVNHTRQEGPAKPRQ